MTEQSFLVKCQHKFTKFSKNFGTECDRMTKVDNLEEIPLCCNHKKRSSKDVLITKYNRYLTGKGIDPQTLKKCEHKKCEYLVIPGNDFCMKHVNEKDREIIEFKKCLKCDNTTSSLSQLCSKHSKLTIADIDEIFSKFANHV